MESSSTTGSWLDPAVWQSISWDSDQIKAFAKANRINIMLFLVFVFISVRQWLSRYEAAKKAGADRQSLPAPNFPEIQQLPKFDWTKEEPLKLRTFKPKYFLTMGLQNLEPSELILMDKNYHERVKYRKQIIKDHSDIAIKVHDDERIGIAVRELYTFLMGSYLPKRYPKMFKLHFAHFETGDQVMIENTITKEVLPATTTPRSNTKVLLTTLGRTLDEDFLLLLPETDSHDPKYVLQALDVVCPSGWDPREKIGKRLSAIHDPVPGYSEKLEGSMDKYFKTLEVGKYVKRTNWSIVTDGDLFRYGASSNHAHEGDIIEEVTEIDPENTFLRCERQTLHRLPASKAIVFAFKTYMYSLKEVKEEGLGEELAEAVDGMKTGNAPGIHFYKRGAVWGKPVTEYLRS